MYNEKRAQKIQYSKRLGEAMCAQVRVPRGSVGAFPHSPLRGPGFEPPRVGGKGCH